MCDVRENHENHEAPQTKKSIMSQFVATIGLNLMMIDLVLSISFSTIVISALLGRKNSMSLTEEQASWFGSVYMIAQPFGSLISGFTLESLGRKKALLLVNIPHIVAWIVMSFAPNVMTLLITYMFMGFGTGFMEAPLLSYLGEVSHPSLRGAITTLGQVFGNLGTFLIYFLGSIMDWRSAALVSTSIPVIAFIIIIFIPEAPVWLISKGKHDDALKALCWVRGWTKPEKVQKEFDELIAYQKNSTRCNVCSEFDCTHKNAGILNKMKQTYHDFTRKEMLRPVGLSIFCFVCMQLIGNLPTRPNMINIYKCFGFSVDAHLATVITGGVGVLGSVIVLSLLNVFGKRPLMLTSMACCSLCTLALGTYAYFYIDHNTSSYNIDSIHGNPMYSWFPMVIFILFNLLASGALSIPWIIICEVFPLKGKGIAAGCCAAAAYVIGSISIKSYYNLEKSLGIYGVFWLYCGTTLVGLIVLYLFLPETEEKSLEEIEKYFNGEHVKVIPNNWVGKKVDRLINKSRNKQNFEPNIHVYSIQVTNNKEMT